jgi:hypothetical protein
MELNTGAATTEKIAQATVSDVDHRRPLKNAYSIKERIFYRGQFAKSSGSDAHTPRKLWQ